LQILVNELITNIYHMLIPKRDWYRFMVVTPMHLGNYWFSATHSLGRKI
jgi:hypothetical protein